MLVCGLYYATQHSSEANTNRDDPTLINRPCGHYKSIQHSHEKHSSLRNIIFSHKCTATLILCIGPCCGGLVLAVPPGIRHCIVSGITRDWAQINICFANLDTTMIPAVKAEYTRTHRGTPVCTQWQLMQPCSSPS